jgi:hypothetical protein
MTRAFSTGTGERHKDHHRPCAFMFKDVAGTSNIQSLWSNAAASPGSWPPSFTAGPNKPSSACRVYKVDLKATEVQSRYMHPLQCARSNDQRRGVPSSTRRKGTPLASRRVEADPRFFQNSKVRYTIFSAAFCTCCLKAIPLPP